MSTEGWIAIISAIGGGTVAIIGAIALAYRQAVEAKTQATAARDATEENRKEIIATKTGIYEVGKQLDGRLTELLISSNAAARAEGVAAGEQSQRDRAAPSDSVK
jgi:hypothetical protein